MTKKAVKQSKRKQEVSRIPAHYPRAAGDTVTVPFKFTQLITLPASASTVGKLLVLGRGTSTGDYLFFNDQCAQFLGLMLVYTRWMISDLEVEVRATGVGGTANTFVASSYIPSNTSVDNPPTGIGEVSQAMHYAESSLGTTGKFRVKPTDYFNDWRQLTDGDDSDAQCGLIQLYGSGSASSGPSTAGVYTVSGVLHFCGLRI